jgi:hypothetical protein
VGVSSNVKRIRTPTQSRSVLPAFFAECFAREGLEGR